MEGQYLAKSLDELIGDIKLINEEFDGYFEKSDFIEKLDENGRNRFNSIYVAFKDIEVRFTNALSYMVPESKINNNNINNGITWIKNGLKIADNYNNYNMNSDFSKGFAILANLASTMPLPVAEASERLNDAARSLSLSIDHYQSKYRRNIEELETMRDRLINITSDLEEKEHYINKKWNELETMRDQLIATTNNLEEKEHYINKTWNELENKMNEQQQVLDHQYSSFQADFLNNQTERSTIFNSFMKELEDKKYHTLEQIKKSGNRKIVWKA